MAAGVVASMRPLSPAFLALIVVTVALAAAEPRRLRELAADRRVRAGLAVLGVVVVAAVVYVVANRSYDAVIGYTFADDPSRFELARRSWARSWTRLTQMIGVFGSLDAPLPSIVAAAWVAAIGALAVLAVIVGRWRQRLVMVAVAAGCVLLPVAAEIVSGPRTGLAWQGRYTLTIAVGAPILAGWIIDRSQRVPRRVALPIGAVVAVAVAAGQVVAQVRALNRYVVGLPSSWFAAIDDGTWNGPSTPAVLISLVVVAAAAYAAWLCAIAWSASDGPPSGRRELVVDDDAQGREQRPGQVDDLVGSEDGAAQAVGTAQALEP